jgi:hypothetical protein
MLSTHSDLNIIRIYAFFATQLVREVGGTPSLVSAGTGDIPSEREKL